VHYAYLPQLSMGNGQQKTHLGAGGTAGSRSVGKF
jgi:hypothetical protein